MVAHTDYCTVVHRQLATAVTQEIVFGGADPASAFLWGRFCMAGVRNGHSDFTEALNVPLPVRDDELRFFQKELALDDLESNALEFARGSTGEPVRSKAIAGSSPIVRQTNPVCYVA
jgi:hypothetical protein